MPVTPKNQKLLLGNPRCPLAHKQTQTAEIAQKIKLLVIIRPPSLGVFFSLKYCSRKWAHKNKSTFPLKDFATSLRMGRCFSDPFAVAKRMSCQGSRNQTGLLLEFLQSFQNQWSAFPSEVDDQWNFVGWHKLCYNILYEVAIYQE